MACPWTPRVGRLDKQAYHHDDHTFRLQDKLQYGLIGINEVLIVMPEAPFGGMKESGMGKEGSWQGMDDYLETKYTCIGGL